MTESGHMGKNLRCASKLGLLGLFVTMALALAACTRDDEWKPLPVSEGGFSVLMRPQPQYARQVLDTPAGNITAHLYSSDRPDSYFAVGYSDYPIALVLGSSPDALFAGVRDTWVRRIDGRLGVSSPLRLEGKYQGLEFTAEGRVKDVDTFLQARIYLVDQRLYQVIAMGKKAEFPQAVANRFLNSFKLIPTAEIGTLPVRPPGGGK
ncbi:MAG TPA: hypothetical protein VED01_01345 [Burkholderiales bacterium]|nr:hypothetical protein [Burkholderiales bacterium]